ncbi:MAG: rod shape-determining protein MreC [Candidatus Parcubacteria bacterium]|jgi:cell shape-determining protein MreC|nr:rod shape-determining protein MreC [Candidatus Parcubacteria bacterium]
MVVAVAIIHFLRPHLFPALFTSVARPFWRTELAIKLGSLTSPEGLLQENELLKRQLSDEALRLATVRAVEMENAELKALLGRASTTPYVLSAVLKRPPVSPYDELVIDAGADHNFNLNDNVYAPGNVLIGRISEVLGQTSKVALFSSPGEKYEVLIGTSHAPATALGRGGGQYEADLPRDVKVSKGDFVIAPSRGDKPFGTVISVATDPAEPFEKILFAPPVNEYELRWVLVDNSTAL